MSTTTTSCACKGIRTCLLCESIKSVSTVSPTTSNNNIKTYYFCQECQDKAWLSQDHKEHVFDTIDTKNEFIQIKGVYVEEEVITKDEEQLLANNIDEGKWINSQSGRRKQDFGPKVNFKKKKVKTCDFHGFPKYISNIFQRISANCNQLTNFDPIEMCHLEYEKERGSSIDPHFDDDWIWGERLVTINYLSSTFLTLTLPKDAARDVAKDSISSDDIEIRIKMNPRSLLILTKEARYKWMHCIKREDITTRRLATTWRELTDEFKVGGKSCAIGKQLLEIASRDIP